MKKILSILALISFATFANAQSVPTDSVKPTTVTPFIGFEMPPSQQAGYSDSTLNTMSKMKLTEVYLAEVEKLAMSLPYSPFTLNRADSLSQTLDIPDSKYIDRKLKSVKGMSESYGDLMKKRLYEIVPYSDTKEIINAILFLQEVNWDLKQTVKK